jgi:hypothetical protein
MRQTRAESTLPEGELVARRETLLRVLTEKFNSVPVEIEAKILATRNGHRLLIRLVAYQGARCLSDIPFGAESCGRKVHRSTRP